MLTNQPRGEEELSLPQKEEALETIKSESMTNDSEDWFNFIENVDNY